MRRVVMVAGHVHALGERVCLHGGAGQPLRSLSTTTPRVLGAVQCEGCNERRVGWRGGWEGISMRISSTAPR